MTGDARVGTFPSLGAFVAAQNIAMRDNGVCWKSAQAHYSSTAGQL